MNKITAIQKITEILKPRVVCRDPKQRQSKIFRQISNEAFIICSQYIKTLNDGILADTLKREKNNLYQKAFVYGKEHWTREAIKRAESLIKSQPWWLRIWWAINPGKMDIAGAFCYFKRSEVDNEGENDAGASKEDDSL